MLLVPEKRSVSFATSIPRKRPAASNMSASDCFTVFKLAVTAMRTRYAESVHPYRMLLTCSVLVFSWSLRKTVKVEIRCNCTTASYWVYGIWNFSMAYLTFAWSALSKAFPQSRKTINNGSADLSAWSNALLALLSMWMGGHTSSKSVLGMVHLFFEPFR